MDKNEWLATKVMMAKTVVTKSGNYYAGLTGWVDGWQPAGNIAQAFMLLDKFRFKALIWLDISNVWQVELGDSMNGLCTVRSGSLPAAITEAVLKSSGYYEE